MQLNRAATRGLRGAARPRKSLRRRRGEGVSFAAPVGARQNGLLHAGPAHLCGDTGPRAAGVP